MKIKDIPKYERPIERLLQNGVEALSNEELLSILIRCGTKEKSAKELSLQVLNEVKNINNLKNMTINKLQKIKGIGISKAAIISASVELGKRVYISTKSSYKENFDNSKKIYDSFKSIFIDKKQEYFYCLYFDNKQHLVGKEKLFIGTINQSIVHPREVFKYAYLYEASSIICMHNHPSGDITPSVADKELTDALVKIGILNKIPVIDHIIIGCNSYYSFRDNGQINNRWQLCIKK